MTDQELFAHEREHHGDPYMGLLTANGMQRVALQSWHGGAARTKANRAAQARSCLLQRLFPSDILRHAFRDATGSYMLIDHELTGVFLSDTPLDINEGAQGDQVLMVEFLDDVDVDDFELVEEGEPYRKWCVPAALINARATVKFASDPC